MKDRIFVGVSIAFGALTLSTTDALAAPSIPRPVVETADVARFYRLYDAAHGHPSAQALQDDYIDSGSPGLRHLAQIRGVTGEKIASAITAHPEIFSDAKRCMAVLPSVHDRVSAALLKLRQLYPEAVFPPITITVSRGKPVGVADSTGVMIGLEALCAVNYLGANLQDRFVHTITHEFAHVQQAKASPRLYNDPKPTVLASSLIEGGADFTATLISGEAHYKSPYAPDPSRYKAVETQFLADKDKTDLSQWIDNGSLTDPGDLGYWVGYRIVKSYYEHSANKGQALRDILEMKDPKAFLARSGWHPGAEG